MKKNKKVNENKNIAIAVIAAIAVILLISFLLTYFKDYSKASLNTNNKAIFTVVDLTVDNLKYGDNEKAVLKEMGKPKKEEEIKQDIYNYKKLHYDGIIFTLKENYDDYMLVKVEITDSKYIVSRKIKVNDKIMKVIKKYKIENKNSSYMYGNYSTDALNEGEIKENIYLGIRTKQELVYVNRDAVVGNKNSNIARMNISYKYGKITKIIWSYDLK